MRIFGITILLLLCGCSKLDDKKSRIVEIDGYTYYDEYRQMAPTPETIKRCMREVIKENTGELK